MVKVLSLFTTATPTVWVPNDCEPGLMVRLPRATPEPSRFAITEPPGLAEATRFAVLPPCEVGLKETVTVQVPRGASVAHPLVAAKSPALVPVMIGVTVPLGLPPVLVMVKLAVELVEPTVTEPKLLVIGVIVSTAGAGGASGAASGGVTPLSPHAATAVIAAMPNMSALARPLILVPSLITKASSKVDPINRTDPRP